MLGNTVGLSVSASSIRRLAFSFATAVAFIESVYH